jgi:hypothetical protein
MHTQPESIMNPSHPTPRQTGLRDGEWEWLNRPGRFRVGGVTRSSGQARAGENTNRETHKSR